MNALFREGPSPLEWMHTALKGAALALLLIFAWVGQSLACYPQSCVMVEKYVSVNGLAGPWVSNSSVRYDPVTDSLSAFIKGENNVPAADVPIPVANFGGTKVMYRFDIINCGKIALYNVHLGDCIDPRSVGAPGFLEGSRDTCVWDPLLLNRDVTTVTPVLGIGERVTVYSSDFELDPISSVDICEKFGHDRTNGIVRNNASIFADADMDGNGMGEKVCTYDDLNLVKCEEYKPIPAALGDRVWRDLNGNGIQDCQDSNHNGIIGDAGDVGDECGAGVPGVKVDLLGDCNQANVMATATTDANGFYLFQNLNPGDYCVKFHQETVPNGTCASGLPQFTTQHVGTDDAVDSDADQITGISSRVHLDNGQTNRTLDAGIVCQQCPLAVDKKCQVSVPVTSTFVCSNAKPIDSISMIWTGQSGIYVKAWKGTPGSTLLATIGAIANGERVTVSGMGGSPLDQFWEIFSGPPDPSGSNKIGLSDFHISCSDVDMNGPEDCGKLEGNAKTTGGTLINLWQFDGMSGNGQTLTCTPPSQTGTDACTFSSQIASCQSLGAKPKSLVFRYTGSDCSASKNNQAPDKWFCNGTPGPAPTITIVKDPTRITVSPLSNFNIGDLITVSAIGSDMGAEIQLQVGGQALKIHTSCSQPLAVGDVFGSLELVRFNGQGAGSEVTYFYDVKNSGSNAVDITSVLDNKLGELLSQPATLQPGGTLSLQKTAFITQTTSNEVTATAHFAGSSAVCGQASDQLTVSVTKPTCSISVVFDAIQDTAVNFKVTDTSKIKATLDTFLLNFPASYGFIKEIRLDGSIWKSSATVPVLGSGVMLTTWTNPDITKRQLDPGETRTLQVIFTKKGLASDWAAIQNLGGITFKEGCQATFPHKQ